MSIPNEYIWKHVFIENSFSHLICHLSTNSGSAHEICVFGSTQWSFENIWKINHINVIIFWLQLKGIVHVCQVNILGLGILQRDHVDEYDFDNYNQAVSDEVAVHRGSSHHADGSLRYSSPKVTNLVWGFTFNCFPL